MKITTRNRALFLATAMLVFTIASTKLKADTGTCGGQMITLPFTDVPSSSIFFCSIAEAYFSGLTNGTTPTTFSPAGNVPREQMAAFTTRTMDQSIKRSSRRAALDQFWTTSSSSNFGLTTVGNTPWLVKSDGQDLWVANKDSNTVSRVRASDGKLLETWTDAGQARGVLVAMGKVFVTGKNLGEATGAIFQIDPTQAPGSVTTLTNGVGQVPLSIAFDGQKIWTANETSSISIITLNPVTVTNIFTGFNLPIGLVYDGTNMWVTDAGDDTLKRLDANGAILQSIPVGNDPHFPAFDGTNIWVPNTSAGDIALSSLSVVRATGVLQGTVLATFTGNGLFVPLAAAFDGERIMVTNANGISIWKASDLTVIGTLTAAPGLVPTGVCSDGLNFWFTLQIANKLARF